MTPVEIGAEAQKFILVFFRIVSVLWLVPVLSSRYISALFKAGLSILIAFLLYGSVSVTPAILNDPYVFALLVAREILIGLTISFIVRIIFSAVSVAGDIISIQAGFSFAQFMDPFSMTQASVVTQVKNLLAIMIFFAMDAHYILFKALSTSFKLLPIGSASFREPLLNYLISSTAKIFSLGFKIGSPIIVTLFLMELAFGMLARMLPQVNIFIEGVPIKILVTTVLLSFSLAIIAPVIAGLFKGMEGDFMRVIRIMG